MTEMSPAEAVFFAALEKATPAEREAYLDAACAGQPELRARVDRLLAAHPRIGGFLEAEGATELAGTPDRVPPADGDTTAAVSREPRDGTTVLLPTAAEAPGTLIARKYKLIEPIGEGGMGTVYMAQQTTPVKRAVAVKVIKDGMDSRAVLARFEAERQALAMMDHPNIARVLDAGTTESGRPFFVMELVKGVPITQYCDDRKLTPRQRLELFVPVCQAIQHAHQKGVIHRDIKPSNVLIALYDDKPVPKVIDFGVAKAAGQTLTDKTLMTGFGALIGTPEYMSPEQAKLNNLDIDTRSDVYSLGVLLYELLTGSTPVDRKSLGKAALLEVLRIVREVEAPRPSARLSTIDTLASVAANRGTEPARLSKAMKGELDWVVLKALEKDRSRRYDTANGLARDIQRYLADEAVEARPPSAGYRFGKFLKRHKAPVIAASLVLLATLGGIAGTTFGLLHAQAAQRSEARQRANAVVERDRAIAAEREIATERDKAIASETRAREEAAKAQAINDFLTQGLLRQAEPANHAVEDKITVLEVLDRAAETVGTRLAGHPELERAIRETIARTYHGLASWEKAEMQWSALLDEARRRDPRSAETYNAQGELAHILRHRGRRDAEVVEMAETAAKGLERTLGPDDDDTLTALNGLALLYEKVDKLPEAIALFERVRNASIATVGPEHPSTLTVLGNLAGAYGEVDRFSEAVALYERVRDVRIVKPGPKHPDTLNTLYNLALTLKQSGKLREAIALLERVRDAEIAKLGPDHPDTLMTLSTLAGAYRVFGRHSEALALYARVRDARIAKYPPDHPDTLSTLNGLAQAYFSLGRFSEAIPLFERVRDARIAKLGPNHRATLNTLSNLAETYCAAGRVPEAIDLFENVRDAQISTLGPEHSETLNTLSSLAFAYGEAGELPEAIALYERVRDSQIVKFGPDHPDTLRNLSNLAAAYWKTKQLDKSVPLFEEVLRRREATLGRQNLDTQGTVGNLGVNYKDAGRIKDAIPLLEEVVQAAKGFPALRVFTSPLIDAYAQAGENAKLADLILEQLPEARKSLPKDSPQLAGMLASLGLSLLQQKKWTEAEPILRECLAIREEKEPDELRTFNTKSVLGGSLLGQKKYTEAEPLLLAGYEGMKQREAAIPEPGKVRLPEALDRLIELYTATDKPAEVKKWQAERAKYPTTQPLPGAENK